MGSKDGDGDGGQWRFYPPAMIRALAVVWLFSGLRHDEIMRLRVGCVRWQESPAGADGSAAPGRKICLLDVPVNKTGIAFTRRTIHSGAVVPASAGLTPASTVPPNVPRSLT